MRVLLLSVALAALLACASAQTATGRVQAGAGEVATVNVSVHRSIEAEAAEEEQLLADEHLSLSASARAGAEAEAEAEAELVAAEAELVAAAGAEAEADADAEAAAEEGEPFVCVFSGRRLRNGEVMQVSACLASVCHVGGKFSFQTNCEPGAGDGSQAAIQEEEELAIQYPQSINLSAPAAEAEFVAEATAEAAEVAAEAAAEAAEESAEAAGTVQTSVRTSVQTSTVGVAASGGAGPMQSQQEVISDAIGGCGIGVRRVPYGSVWTATDCVSCVCENSGLWQCNDACTGGRVESGAREQLGDAEAYEQPALAEQTEEELYEQEEQQATVHQQQQQSVGLGQIQRDAFAQQQTRQSVVVVHQSAEAARMTGQTVCILDAREYNAGDVVQIGDCFQCRCNVGGSMSCENVCTGQQLDTEFKEMHGAAGVVQVQSAQTFTVQEEAAPAADDSNVLCIAAGARLRANEQWTAPDGVTTCTCLAPDSRFVCDNAGVAAETASTTRVSVTVDTSSDSPRNEAHKPATCSFNGVGLYAGEQWPAGDGINMCQCFETGDVLCTRSAFQQQSSKVVTTATTTTQAAPVVQVAAAQPTIVLAAQGAPAAVAAAQCSYNGRVLQSGESVRPDPCNVCTCEVSGALFCSSRVCPASIYAATNWQTASAEQQPLTCRYW